MAHAIDLLVDLAFLLNEGVGPRHVGFGLVVVVIGDEVFHRVVGKEVLELTIKLRGERLVVGEHHRRALGALDDLRHGVGLARAGDAEQNLGLVLIVDSLDQVGDGGGLVALGLVVGLQLERDAAFGFDRPLWAVWFPSAFPERRVTVLDQIFQRFDGGCHAIIGRQVLGVFQRNVHTGDRVQARSGTLFRIMGATKRGAACGFGRFFGRGFGLLLCSRLLFGFSFHLFGEVAANFHRIEDVYRFSRIKLRLRGFFKSGGFFLGAHGCLYGGIMWPGKGSDGSILSGLSGARQDKVDLLIMRFQRETRIPLDELKPREDLIELEQDT